MSVPPVCARAPLRPSASAFLLPHSPGTLRRSRRLSFWPEPRPAFGGGAPGLFELFLDRSGGTDAAAGRAERDDDDEGRPHRRGLPDLRPALFFLRAPAWCRKSRVDAPLVRAVLRRGDPFAAAKQAAHG